MYELPSMGKKNIPAEFGVVSAKSNPEKAFFNLNVSVSQHHLFFALCLQKPLALHGQCVPLSQWQEASRLLIGDVDLHFVSLTSCVGIMRNILPEAV